MLKEYNFDDITVYKMGRTVGPVVPYLVHAFLLGDTLIDTGTAHAQREFLSALSGKKITRIINTHFHEDHTGNNAVIQGKYAAEILAHRDSLQYIEHTERIPLKPYQILVWKRPEPSHATEITDRVTIPGYSFNVIHTRGHSEGHVCLYEPDRKWLFTGDLFCGIRNIYLRCDEDYKTMLESLERLSTLKIETIFCGLKGIVTNGQDALDQKIRFMREMIENTRSLHESGLSVRRIRNRLLGREDMMYYMTAGHFSKGYLIENILKG